MSDNTDATDAPPADAGPAAGGSAATSIRVNALWLSDASRQRLADAVAAEMTTTLDELAEGTDLVLVSTRLPRVRTRATMQQITSANPGRVIVVCHAGGEATAVALLELGADSLIAEGNESSLALTYPDAALGDGPPDENGLITSEAPPDPEALVTGFRQRLETADSSGSGLYDRGSGLPGAGALESMLTERARRGLVPRLGYLEICNADTVFEAVDERTAGLVLQRMVLLMEGACRAADAQLFELSPASYAFLGDDINGAEADALSQQLVTIGSSFRPDGVEVLEVALGHAGPDVADNDRALRDLAQRALSAATVPGGGIVNAGDQSADEAIETELNAGFAVLDHLHSLDDEEPHGPAVADLAIELARELGYDQGDLVRLRLSALFHDVGKLTLGRELAMATEDDLSGDDLAQWQRHPALGAEYLRTSAGPDVAEAVAHHHENWDGSGFPNGVEGDAIPFDARILAVADTAAHATGRGEDPVEAVRAGEGTRFDPAVVDAFALVYASSAAAPAPA